MIRFTRVSKRYEAQVALADVDWEVAEGEFCVVLGSSGVGKTSLLRLLTMEELPTEGQVQVGSFVSGRTSAAQRAQLRRSLGIVFEDFKLLGDRSVFENIALVLRITGTWDRAALEQRVSEVLAWVGLPGRARAQPRELSAGEKQRVALARAIVHKPLVLLADEPTGDLDRESGEGLIDLLFQVHAAGTTIVLATNSAGLAQQLADRGARCVELHDGALGPFRGAAPTTEVQA